MGTPKKLCKALIGSLFKKILLSSPKNLKIIIMYHKVVEQMPEKMHDPNLLVTSNTLDMHIHELKKYFKILPLNELMCIGNNHLLSCALTFDDGWRDNYDIAFPILRRYNVNATIFLPVIDIGTSHWFWFEHIFYLANVLQSRHKDPSDFINHFRNSAPQWNPDNKLCIPSVSALTEIFKSQPSHLINEVIQCAYNKFKVEFPSENILMEWDQVYEMGGNGISFGSHGLEHNILPLLDRRAKIEAVVESLAILKRDKNIASIPFFSYPNGNWDLEIVEFLKMAGYHGATTTKNGCADKANPFLLNRIGCSESSSNTPNLLWFQIAKAFFASNGIYSTN